MELNVCLLRCLQVLPAMYIDSFNGQSQRLSKDDENFWQPNLVPEDNYRLFFCLTDPFEGKRVRWEASRWRKRNTSLSKWFQSQYRPVLKAAVVLTKVMKGIQFLIVSIRIKILIFQPVKHLYLEHFSNMPLFLTKIIAFNRKKKICRKKVVDELINGASKINNFINHNAPATW